MVNIKNIELKIKTDVIQEQESKQKMLTKKEILPSKS